MLTKYLAYKVCGVIKFLIFFEFIKVIKKQIVHFFQYRRALHECTELLAGAIKWNWPCTYDMQLFM